MRDERANYFRGLENSDRPRVYLRGADPEDERKQWLFEVVEDNGRRVAIKQIEAEPSGVTHRYWWRHLEDDHGFLTDQPLDRWDVDAVSEISREDFQRLWTRSSSRDIPERWPSPGSLHARASRSPDRS